MAEEIYDADGVYLYYVKPGDRKLTAVITTTDYSEKWKGYISEIEARGSIYVAFLSRNSKYRGFDTSGMTDNEMMQIVSPDPPANALRVVIDGEKVDIKSKILVLNRGE